MRGILTLLVGFFVIIFNITSFIDVSAFGEGDSTFSSSAEDPLEEAANRADQANRELDEGVDRERANSLNQMSGNSSSTPSTGSPLTSPNFKFNTSNINPSSNPNAFARTGSSTENVKKLLQKIAETLLVVVSVGAVLFIVVGGFFMVTSAGDTEKANRGKIIITYNLIALALAMLSYGIMRLVVWIIG